MKLTNTSPIFRMLGLLLLAILLGAWPGVSRGETSEPKPISKSGLEHALQIGGLSEKELVEQVTRRGVNFSLTTAVEGELRHVGADDALIAAVRANYRQDAETIGSKDGTDSGIVSSAPVTDSGSALPASSAGASAHPATLREVHRLYIEKMPDGLDEYLRAAISNRLSSSFVIVLDLSAADAILQSTDAHIPGAVEIVDPSRKVILWSGVADDKEKVYLNLRRGGQRELAEKLTSQLKKSLR